VTIYNLIAAYVGERTNRGPVDSRAEDRYYTQYGTPMFPSALRIHAPWMAVVAVIIVGIVAG
jgi:hypothetical protein